MYGYKRPYYSSRGRYNSSARYYNKYNRRGTIGRAIAGAAAAKRSDKTETFSCTVNGIIAVGLAANTNLTTVGKIAPFSGGLLGSGIVNDDANLVHGGAVNDRTFRMKCACYDEVKLDTMNVTITPAQYLADNTITMTLCTFWDRKATPKECGWTGNQEWMANGAQPTALEIYNNEGTMKSNITHNNIYGFRRWCQASSILEKGGYVDSSIYYNPTAEESPLKWMHLDAWYRNPMAFSPCLYMTIYCPATFAANRILSYSYKVEYTFTFRNPKSDLDYFLEIESPGYINPQGEAGRNAAMTPAQLRQATRSAESGSLLTDLQKFFALNSMKTMETTTAAKTIDDLFVQPKLKETTEEKEEETKMEEEETK